MPKRIFPWIIWPTAVTIVFGATYLLWRSEQRRRPTPPIPGEIAKNNNDTPPDDDDPPPPETLKVKVLKPRRGAMELITTQVGSVQAYEMVHLRANVSGYLDSQTVDIGARVKKGDVLATIAVPELEIQAERNAATVDQMQARVKQMEAKVAIAEADLKAAEAHIVQVEANAKSAAAFVVYRGIRHKQMKDLYTLSSIEGVKVDETKEHLEAAKEASNAATAAIATARAQHLSTEAKIRLAKADVVEAMTHVRVAEADLKKTNKQISYAKIRAKFDGYVTARSLFPGDFVRSASDGGGLQPLLTIQRTDLMRVIVQVPDRFVPDADPGDTAIVEIVALREKYHAEVSRISRTEDKETRLMQLEIDLPNTKGNLRQGMFGKVTIMLDRATNQLSIPTDCLTGDGKDTVFVFKNGKAQLKKVQLGSDNGVRVEVLKGLETDDQVITRPPSALRNGLEVEATLADESLAVKTP